MASQPSCPDRDRDRNQAGFSVVSVVILLFLQSSTCLGMVKTVGVLLPSMSASLHLSATDTGITLGLFSGLTFCPAPFLSCLYRRLSASKRRRLLIIGAFLPACGTGLTSLAGNNAQLASYMAVAGLGQGILTISTVLELNERASDKFNRLFIIAKSGYSVGMVLIPLLADFLQNIYGWRGAMLILGGLQANLIPVAAAIGPSKRKRSAEDASDEMASDGDSGGSSNRTRDYQRLLSSDITDTDSGTPHVSHIGKRKASLESPRNIGDPTLTSEGASTSWCTAPDSPDEHMLVASSDKLQEVGDEAVRERLLQEHLSIASTGKSGEGGSSLNFCQDDDALDSFEERSPERCEDDTTVGKWNRIIRAVKESDSYRDPNLVLVLISNVPYAMAVGGWYSFLIPMAMERGIPVLRALALSFCAAVSYFLVRVFVGMWGRRLEKWVLDVYLALTGLNIISLTIDILFSVYAVMLMTSLASALCISLRSVFIFIIVREIVSHESFPLAVGVLEFLYGAGSMLGAYLSGVVADTFGSFSASFVMIAVLEVLVFLLLIPPRCCHGNNSGREGSDDGASSLHGEDADDARSRTSGRGPLKTADDS